MKNRDYKEKWRTHYSNWQNIWRDPKIAVTTKVVLHDIYLYRSDKNGWYISERKLAQDLGIGKETVSKALNDCIRRGLIHTSTTIPRKRRKLYLAGFLQSPVWTPEQTNNWIPLKPSKYQKKYQENGTLKGDNLKTDSSLPQSILHERIKNNEVYKRLTSSIAK